MVIWEILSVWRGVRAKLWEFWRRLKVWLRLMGECRGCCLWCKWWERCEKDLKEMRK